jgi:hypothetical protein
VPLCTAVYESLGLNIGEAMAVGAFPVVHDLPGAELLPPVESLFAGIVQAVALVRSSGPELYSDRVVRRYGLERQQVAPTTSLADPT